VVDAGKGEIMGRFQSKEEYERWRATQRGGEPPPPPVDTDAPAAEQVYDGPAPGSSEFVDRSLRHAGLATDREKNLAMLCHLIALAGFIIPFGNILGPLIVWMIGKSDSDFVNEHGKSSLNFQISFTLFFIVCVVLILFIGPIAVVLMAGSLLYAVVMVIVNGVKAHNGEDGAYALTIQFLS
jgi:uncharacterized Tic20 family protein